MGSSGEAGSSADRGERRRIALVTGGASGIGRAAALAFARAGAEVIALDVDETGGAETVRLIVEAGGAARFVHASVADPDEMQRAFDEVEQRYGTIDVALNNAGIEQQRGTIVDTPLEHWDRTITTNLRGVWLSLKHELRLMIRAGRGSIVNTSSMVGLIAARGAASYVASKHGILGLTKAAALEAAESGVRVNAVCPGHILTPMVQRVIDREPAKETEYLTHTPLHRLGTPEEVAEAVVWLCSDAASFVTGAALQVDGGVLLS